MFLLRFPKDYQEDRQALKTNISRPDNNYFTIVTRTVSSSSSFT
jgi:hypothetical protein